MKIQRTKNAKRNIKFGVISKFLGMVLSFLIKTVMIRTLGVEYLGLNTIFSSVLQVLNITELGFSSALVYSMYRPIAEDNTEMICALLNLYRKVYRIVGLIILILGCMLIPMFDFFIKGDIPGDINIYVIYAVFLLDTVISYWAFAYKSAIPNAYQRKDIIDKAHIISQVAQTFSQILCLVLIKSYYLYVIILPVSTILNNFLVSYYTSKYYPQYQCKGNVPRSVLKDIKKKVSGLLIQKVCGTTRNSLDSICISAFLGLTLTAVYNNYLYIVTALSSMSGIIGEAIMAGVGNSMAVDGPEKNYFTMRKIDFLYMQVSGWCTICLICLYQPFMELWVGKELTLPFGVAVCFALYFYVLRIGDIRSTYSGAAGLWWENRFRAIAESVANIVLNIVLVQFMGVYGIIIGTLISLLFINQIYGSSISFQYYFKNGKHGEYLFYHLRYFLVTAGIGTITYFICSFVQCNLWLVLIIRAMICTIFPTVLYLLFYCRTREYREAVEWLIERMPMLQGFRKFFLLGNK